VNTNPATDDDLFVPEISGPEWAAREIPSRLRTPGEKTEIRLDGAIAYEVRLIPSRRVLGRFASTLDAWPAIIREAEAGRSPRTLSLDAIGAAGERWHMAAGPFLLAFARLNDGGPHPNDNWVTEPRRVAETA